MTAPDPTMISITTAVEQGRTGDPAGARAALTALWDTTGDAFHRCTIAHFLADLQDIPEEELAWDERALAAVAGLTDERLQQYDKSLQVRAFLPSLHLSLADDHRRLAAPVPAPSDLAASNPAAPDPAAPDPAVSNPAVSNPTTPNPAALDQAAFDRAAEHLAAAEAALEHLRDDPYGDVVRGAAAAIRAALAARSTAPLIPHQA